MTVTPVILRDSGETGKRTGMAGAGNSGRLYRGLFRFWRGEYTELRSWIGIRSPSKAETLVGFALDQALGPGMTINPPWKSTGNRFCSNEFRHKRGGLFPKIPSRQFGFFSCEI